jgi:hypothetical protein
LNSDLHLVLDAMLRQAKQSLRNTGLVSPFAAILSSQGKVSLLAGPVRPPNSSLQIAVRTLEAGLHARIRQGMCKAVGVSFAAGEAQPTDEDALQIVLEYSDGTACQLTIPFTNQGIVESTHRCVVTTSVAAKFFVNAMIRSA